MALQFYSNLTKAYYNTAEEAEAAEVQYQKEQQEQADRIALLRQERKDAAEELKKVYAARDEKYKEFLESNDEAKKAFAEFKRKFGGYHTTITEYSPVISFNPRQLVDEVWELFKNL